MYSPQHNEQLHTLIAELEAQAFRQWTRAKMRDYSPADALAMAATEVNTDLKRKPGGKISVTISIHGRRSYDDEHFWFSLQSSDFRGYFVAEQDSTFDTY